MMKFRGKEMRELVKCQDCGKHRGYANSCTLDGIVINGKKYQREKNTHFGKQRQAESKDRCLGCGILLRPGNVHHFGCDDEECPRCKGQLISCDCDIAEVFDTKGTKRADRSEWKPHFAEFLSGERYKPPRKRR